MKYTIRPKGQCAWDTTTGWRKALDLYRECKRLAQWQVLIIDQDGNDVTEELKEREVMDQFNKSYRG